MIRTEENQVAFTSKKRFSMRRTLTWTERFIVFFVLAGIASVLTLTLGRKAGYGWVQPFCNAMKTACMSFSERPIRNRRRSTRLSGLMRRRSRSRGQKWSSTPGRSPVFR